MIVGFEPLAAQVLQRELVGKVFHTAEDGMEVVAKGVQVRLEVFGFSTVTNDSGLFRLPLPESIAAGETVELSVVKEGWRIRYPLDGEVRIPARPSSEILKIELLPRGSKLFWANDRIEKFLRDMVALSAQEGRSSGLPGSGFGRNIQEWATRYGLNIDDAKAEIDRWIAEVQNHSSDEYQLGLAAFASKSFDKAAKHFSAAASIKADRLEKVREELARLAVEEEKLLRGLAVDFVLEGVSLYRLKSFRAAASAFKKALEQCDPETEPISCATIRMNLGEALKEQAAQSHREVASPLLAEASHAINGAIEVFDSRLTPLELAAAHFRLGLVLQLQASRSPDEEAKQLLGKAATSYSLALRIYQRRLFPRTWAAIQVKLGGVLSEQASRSQEKLGRRLGRESLKAYRGAMEVFVEEEMLDTRSADGRYLRERLLKERKTTSELDESATNREELLNIEKMLARVCEQSDLLWNATRLGINITTLELAEFDKFVREAKTSGTTASIALAFALYWAAQDDAAEEVSYFRQAALALYMEWMRLSSGDADELEDIFPIVLFGARLYWESAELSNNFARNRKGDPYKLIKVKAMEIASLLAANRLAVSIAKLDELMAKISTASTDLVLTEDRESEDLEFVDKDPHLPHRLILFDYFKALNTRDREKMLAGLTRTRERILTELAGGKVN